MSLSVSIYSNANSATKTVTVDFQGDFLAASRAIPSNCCGLEYYFKFNTSARTDSSVTMPTRVVTKLSDLALNLNKQSATNTANSYSDINSMVVDYIYDYVHGHTANQYTSGCSLQRPMKFT